MTDKTTDAVHQLLGEGADAELGGAGEQMVNKFKEKQGEKIDTAFDTVFSDDLYDKLCAHDDSLERGEFDEIRKSAQSQFSLEYFGSQDLDEAKRVYEDPHGLIGDLQDMGDLTDQIFSSLKDLEQNEKFVAAYDALQKDGGHTAKEGNVDAEKGGLLEGEVEEGSKAGENSFHVPSGDIEEAVVVEGGVIDGESTQGSENEKEDHTLGIAKELFGDNGEKVIEKIKNEHGPNLRDKIIEQLREDENHNRLRESDQEARIRIELKVDILDIFGKGVDLKDGKVLEQAQQVVELLADDILKK